MWRQTAFLFDAILVVAFLSRYQVKHVFNVRIDVTSGAYLDVDVILPASLDFPLAGYIEVSIEVANFEIILLRVAGEFDLVIPDADLDTVIIDA